MLRKAMRKWNKWKDNQLYQEAQQPPKGRPRNTWRVDLAYTTIDALDQIEMPLSKSNDGLLARVLRVVLAAADRIEGVKVEPRRHIKKPMCQWLDQWKKEREERSASGDEDDIFF